MPFFKIQIVLSLPRALFILPHLPLSSARSLGSSCFSSVAPGFTHHDGSCLKGRGLSPVWSRSQKQRLSVHVQLQGQERPSPPIWLPLGLFRAREPRPAHRELTSTFPQKIPQNPKSPCTQLSTKPSSCLPQRKRKEARVGAEGRGAVFTGGASQGPSMNP